jgi:hypothetical protein
LYSCLQIFDGMCWVFLKLKIDDPLSAAPMHGWCGAWACFFVGLLAKPEYIRQSYDRTEYHHGAFYPGSSGRLFASQVRSVQEVLQGSAGECYKRGAESVQEVLRGLRALHTVRLHSQAAALLCQLLI